MLTPAKAAEIAGVSRTTIMKALKNHDLKAVRDNRNRWQIDSEELTRWCDASTVSVTDATVSRDSSPASEIAVLRSELAGRDRIIEILERELAHAKKPFWKRWK
jgi:excisionase family DNA binding protein